MRRFEWPLQRLLGVTVQRERALRGELLSLSRELAGVHQEMFRHQAVIRSLLADLSAESLPQRIAKQEVFMSSSDRTTKLIEALQARAEKLKERRTEVTARFTKARKFRQTLERLRVEARQRYLREQLRIEQKILDQSAQISFARDMIQASLAGER